MAIPPDSSTARFQVDCDPPDSLYKELYERAMRSGATDMQLLGNMVVEIRMLPKDQKDPYRSK
jgi:hypothetical protein